MTESGRHRAACITVGVMPGADAKQAGIFTLGTGIRLECESSETSQIAQHCIQAIDNTMVTLGMFGRGKGVDMGKQGIGNRFHFAGSIEFHGAGSEGDHGTCQGNILARGLSQVPHEFGFRSVAMENFMGQEIAGPAKVFGDGLIQIDIKHVAMNFFRGGSSKHFQQSNHFFPGNGLVQRDAQMILVNKTKVVSSLFCLVSNSPGLTGSPDIQSIEILIMDNFETQVLKLLGQCPGPAINSRGYS